MRNIIRPTRWNAFKKMNIDIFKTYCRVIPYTLTFLLMRLISYPMVNQSIGVYTAWTILGYLILLLVIWITTMILYYVTRTKNV